MADHGRMVQLWLQKSAEDLKLSKLLIDHAKQDAGMLGPLVFHSQQSVEKVIKGFLAFRKVRFDKTHDIKKLLDLMKSIEPSLAEELRPSEILTKFAVAYRYPAEVEPPEPLTHQAGEKALKLAVWVFEELKNKIEKS